MTNQININCEGKPLGVEHIAEIAIKQKEAPEGTEVVLQNVGRISLMTFIKEITGGLFDIHIPIPEGGSNENKITEIKEGMELKLPNGKIVFCESAKEGSKGYFVIKFIEAAAHQ